MGSLEMCSLEDCIHYGKYEGIYGKRKKLIYTRQQKDSVPMEWGNKTHRPNASSSNRTAFLLSTMSTEQEKQEVEKKNLIKKKRKAKRDKMIKKNLYKSWKENRPNFHYYLVFPAPSFHRLYIYLFSLTCCKLVKCFTFGIKARYFSKLILQISNIIYKLCTPYSLFIM